MDLKVLKGKKKISITIDTKLYDKLEKLRLKEKKIALSPIINELLWRNFEDGKCKNNFV